jgi:hypothetical protein
MIRQKVEALERVEEAKRPKKRVKWRIRIHTIFEDGGKVTSTRDDPSTPAPEGVRETVLNIHVPATRHAADAPKAIESMTDDEVEAEVRKLEARRKT